MYIIHYLLIITASVVFAVNSNGFHKCLKRNRDFIEKDGRRKIWHRTEKSASDNLLKDLLEYIATILWSYPSVSFTIYLGHCLDDVGFLCTHIWLPKVKATVQHQIEVNRYSKAKGGRCQDANIFFLLSNSHV